MKTIAAVVAVALGVALAACAPGGDEAGGPGGERNRAFHAEDMLIHPDGRILLAGLARRGDWDSKQDDYCDGDGPATSDFAVVHLSPAGRLVETYSLSEDELDGCAVDVTRAELDADGALVLNGVVRESPGLIPGEGGPETRERDYSARFDPSRRRTSTPARAMRTGARAPSWRRCGCPAATGS